MTLLNQDRAAFHEKLRKLGLTKIGERLALASALKKLRADEEASGWKKGFLAQDEKPSLELSTKKKTSALPNDAFLPSTTVAMLEDDEDDSDNSVVSSCNNEAAAKQESLPDQSGPPSSPEQVAPPPTAPKGAVQSRPSPAPITSIMPPSVAQL